MIKKLLLASAILLCVTNSTNAEEVEEIWNGNMSIKYSATLSGITKTGTVSVQDTWYNDGIGGKSYFGFSSNALFIKKTTLHTFSEQYETYSLTPISTEDSYIVLDDDWTVSFGSSNNFNRPASYEEILEFEDIFLEGEDVLEFISPEIEKKYNEIIERYRESNCFRTGRGSGDSYGLLKGDEVNTMFGISVDTEGYDLQNNLYYAITYKGTLASRSDFTCYSVNSINASEIESFDYNDYKKTYKVTTIPSNFIKSTTQSLTISKSVNNIADDAFINAMQLNEIIINKNGNYKVSNGCLLAYDNVNYTYTLLFVMPNCSSTTIDLDDDVVAMSPNALACVRGVTINSAVLPGKSDAKGNVVNNTSPASVQEATDKEGVTYYKVAGNVNNSDLATIIGTSNNAKYIDFSEATIAESLDLSEYNSNEYNTIYIFGELAQDITVTGNNVVIDGTCANFVLNESAQAFYSPITFKADNATVNRSFSSNWSTICLPFTVSADACDNYATKFNCTTGQLHDYDDIENTFTFVITNQIPAYVATIIKGNGNLPTFEGVTVTKTPVNDDIVKVDNPMISANFVGTLTSVKLDRIDEEGDFYNYGFINNNLTRLNGNTIKGFRAYLEAPRSAWSDPASASARVVDFGGNEIDVIDFQENSTDIEAISTTDDIEVVYNMNGQRVENISAAGIYVVNGKKMIK